MKLKKIFNIVLDAVASGHLAIAVVKMYQAAFPKDILPIDTAFGGKFKYLTFWNVSIETLYFCFCVIENIMSRCSDKEHKPLRKIRDFWFTSIVLPLSAFVCVTFWGLWAIDREMVMPKAIDPYFPSLLNHSVHTFIVVYSVLELFTTYHKTQPKWYKQCSGLWTVTISYLIWCIFVWTQCGMWVYPILEILNWPARIVFFGSCLGLATAFLFGGVYINNFLWKDKIQKNSLQLN